jgi:hypothetical protein
MPAELWTDFGKRSESQALDVSARARPHSLRDFCAAMHSVIHSLIRR